eukprot:11629264-Prorocentrum_lima.AAC.1
MGDIQVEDISNYNRWYECLRMLQPKGKRLNDAIEGFSVGDNTVTTTITALNTAATSSLTELEPMSLAQNAYKD